MSRLRAGLWFLTFILVGGGPALADPYELGHGYSIGSFNFAGYGSVALGLPDEGSSGLALEDLSVFVTGHVNKFINPFVEAELAHFYVAHAGRSGQDQDSSSLVLERLYDDVDLGNSLTFRIGKMLTPVGAWNEIHAVPLVLTAIRPAVTYRNFSQYLTGSSIIYHDADQDLPSIKLYYQPDDEFSEAPTNVEFDHYKSILGLHVAQPLSLRDEVGFSLQQSCDTSHVNQTLIGVDLKYTVKSLTLQGEATYSSLSRQSLSPGRGEEAGGYLAAAYALNSEWALYSWYEEFASRSAESHARDFLGGIVYRPVPAIALKAEFLYNIGGPPVNPTGLFLSWSVLF